MKRTQLYINEELYRVLSSISRTEKKSISELVSSAIAEKYMVKNTIDIIRVVDNLAGIWKDRKDIKNTDAYIRKCRKDTRRNRF